MSVATSRRQLRQQLWTDKNLGELARDAQDALDAIPHVVLRDVVATYMEPMTLALREKPKGIEVLYIVPADAPDQAVTGCNGLCHFQWRPQLGGAVIQNIAGMSTAANGGIRYAFTFRITYAAPKGGS